jgi:hypothetical protein
MPQKERVFYRKIEFHPIANDGGRINFGDAVITFLQRKLLIKAVGDELRHPPFIRSSNRVLILGRNLTDIERL